MAISRIKNQSAQTTINEASGLASSKQINPNLVFATSQGTLILESGNYFTKYVSLGSFVDAGATVSLGDISIKKTQDSVSFFNLSTSESKDILTSRGFSFSTTIGLKYVAYENGLFLGTQGFSSGPQTRSIAAKSTDGLSWDTVILSSSVTTISEIFFAKATDKYYTLLDLDNWRESTDFVSWTSSTAIVGQEHFAYVNNLYFRKPRGTARIQSSTDFVTWTTATTFAPEEYEDITYFNGYYVCANRLSIRKSTNGIVWTTAFSFTSTRFQSIATNGDTIVASGYVANSGTGTANTFWSTDLVNWSTTNTVGVGLSKVRHASAGNLFLINFTTTVFISNDGINWTTGPRIAGFSAGTKQDVIASSPNKIILAFTSTSSSLDVESKALLQIYKQ